MVKNVSLNGDWQCWRVGGGDWIAGHVPGCVHTDLLAVGAIPDPLTEMHELDVLWVDEADWEYERRFVLDDEFCARAGQWLVCDGLDAVAEILINGHAVAKTHNMFRRYWLDVEKYLCVGENTIRIVFRSPTCYGRQCCEQYGCELPGSEYRWSDGRRRKVYRPFVRKAQYQFGWDWGPCLATSGIWRDIGIVGADSPVIEYVTTDQVHHECGVKVVVTTHLKVPTQTNGRLCVMLGEQEAVVPWEGQAGDHRVVSEIDVASPKLWWPIGLGEPSLYPLSVSWIAEHEVEMSCFRAKVGLRNVELVREEDLHGESFFFRINGVDVFCKGANWIPPDPFPTRVESSRYEKLIDSALDANMNMLRVWGGGIYESDIFYQLCDEKGIMVWQDFMFACAAYPADDAFLDEVRAEVRHQVRRLSNHPSIVIWCGDNENEWMTRGWSEKRNAPRFDEAWRKLILETVGPIVIEEDGQRPWWPSSPSNGDGSDPQDLSRGDAHFWEVWHGGKPFERFEEVVPRFCSEFGFQSFPSMPTLHSAIEEDVEDIGSPVMQHHQRHPRGNEIIDKTLERYLGKPKDAEERVFYSQLAHGLALKTAVEHWRRNKPTCMGTLYWQLDDCWVVASWASVDYLLRYKAAHHMAKRFFSPLLGSFEDDGNDLHVWATSDLQKRVGVKFTLCVWHVDGRLIKIVDGDAEIGVAESRKVLSLSRNAILGDGIDVRDVVVELDITDGILRHRNLHTFVPYKDLRLRKPTLRCRVFPADGGFSVVVSTDVVALFVQLLVDGIGGTFDDNIFAVAPGHDVTATYHPLAHDVDARRLSKMLRIRSYGGNMSGNELTT